MDIRNVSDAEKRVFITKVQAIFRQIRNVLDTVEVDMESTDLQVQASAVWIAGNLGNWFHDFMQQIRQIEKQKDNIQEQIKEAVEESISKEVVIENEMNNPAQ